MPPRVRVTVRGLLLAVPAFALVAWAAREVADARRDARRADCGARLNQIGLALHNYHEAYGTFPPAYLLGADGRPAHSWRVLILPFMDHQTLYNSYNFAEPWDGPNNARLAPLMPHTFVCPNRDDAHDPDAWTSYAALVGPATAFPGTRPVALREVRDGYPDTLVVGEVADWKIPWMAPRDLDARGPLAVNGPGHRPGLSSRDGPGAHGLFADGSHQWLPQSLAPEVLRALTTIDGGEPVRAREGGP